jgi:hypothetical protein
MALGSRNSPPLLKGESTRGSKNLFCGLELTTHLLRYKARKNHLQKLCHVTSIDGQGLPDFFII